jgi:hypothetical protein
MIEMTRKAVVTGPVCPGAVVLRNWNVFYSRFERGGRNESRERQDGK